jgi:biopolymer transport protein TolQ
MNSTDLDILSMIMHAGPMVKFVLLLLLFFSVTSWAIMIMKYRYIRTAFSESAEFIDYFWTSRNLSNAFSRAKQLRGSPVARIFRVGYIELNKLSRAGSPKASGSKPSSGGENTSLSSRFTGIDNVKRALRRAINSETTRMTRMVPFLATTGNITPFIGLFGTVWGIMNSFHGIGLRGSASLAVVAPGISEALIATAAGLAAAIPAVIAFNHFMQKIRILDSELHNFSADFLNIIERDIIT